MARSDITDLYVEWYEHVINPNDHNDWIQFADDEGFDVEEAERVWSTQKPSRLGGKNKASASHIVRDKKGNVKLSLEPEEPRSYQHGIGELLHGVDNLMEASWSRNAKGWWNGLTKSDKFNHLRHLKPAFDYRDNSIPPSLYYQDFNSSGQQMIADYFDALQEEDSPGLMKPTTGQHAVHGKKYNVHEVLQSSSGSLSPQKRNKAIRALQSIPRDQTLGKSDVFPNVDTALETLLHGMDNLIASETMPTLSSTRKWWNGLSSNAKRDELRVMSSTVSSDTDCFDGKPKQFDAYCSEQKQDILYYMDASAEKSKKQFHTPYKLPDGRWVGSW